MLNTTKLLYVLTDVAYIAELLPGKKPNSFAVQKFKQVNGEFLDDNEFIAENVVKLFSKLEPEDYHLILPDFLFTNTIVTVKETGDAKVKKHLKDELLPSLGLSLDTHEVESFVLTELKGESKVQLSAIEKSILAPLRVGVAKNKCKIVAISPLSWTIKSTISLEPSISIVQLGDLVYSALQYIGVDQTNQAKIGELDTISETIKTLKGAEPSIQTIYLLSNALVEDKLKELLSDTIPVQQLNSLREDEGKMPSYIQDVIEISAKTLSLEDYQVPAFPLHKASNEEVSELAIEEKTMPKDKLEINEEKTMPDDKVIVESEVEEPKKEDQDLTPLPTPELPSVVKEAEKPPIVDEVTTESKPEVDLSKFISHTTTDSETNNMNQKVDSADQSKVTESAEQKVIIKNSSGVKPMLRMVFITLAVFAATVAIGIGVGLGLLRLRNNNAQESTPVVIAESPIPSPEASASPSPVAEVNKDDVTILVVNATTTAGYAGDIQAVLEAAGYTLVDAGNATGEYETEGYYLLLSEDNPELLSALTADSELELVYDNALEKDVEDASDEYDAVIVLAQPE